MLHWNTGRRPKRSASNPATAAPITMPKKLALATSPVVALDKWNSLLIEPSTKVIVPRSTESKKNAIAMMMKMVRWYPENGSRSSLAAALARG